MSANDVILRLIDELGNGVLEQADLNEDAVGIGVTYEIQKQAWDSLTSASRVEQTVTLPATHKNRALLKYFHLPATNAMSGKPISFLLEIKGVQMLSGRAIVNVANMVGSNTGTIPQNYNLQLLGDNFDWVYLIRGKFLKDLDFWADKSDITVSEITAGIAATYPAKGAGFCLIKYKAWANVAGLGVNVPDLAEFTPFLFVRHIIAKIFESIGRRIVSTFFDSPEFARYILPTPMQDNLGAEFAPDMSKIVAESNILTAPNTLINYNIQTYSPPYAGNPLSGTTYTCGFKGLCKVETLTTHQRIGVASPTAMGLEILRNGSLIYRDFKFTNNLVGEFAYTTPVFNVNAGDVITVRNPQFIVFTTPTNSNIIAAKLTVTVEASAGYGVYNVPVIHKYLLGNWEVRDFLLGLTQTFNLVWYADRIGNVYCEPTNEYQALDALAGTSTTQSGFYNSADFGTTVDLEDMQSAGTVENQSAEFDILEFGFLEDENEDYTKPNKNNQGISFGAARVEGEGNGTLRIEKRKNSFFATCYHTFEMNMSNQNPANPADNTVDICQVPLLYAISNSSKPRTFEPRLMSFFASGVNPFGTMKYTENYTAPVKILNYPFAFAVNYLDDTGLSPVLSYSDVSINQTLRAGLFSRFFAKNLQIAKDNKIINSFFALSLSLVQRFDFRQLIYYKNMYCRCLKIDNYQPVQNAPVKLTLEPVIINPEYTLTNSPISGLV
jgi:hypothetical protein